MRLAAFGGQLSGVFCLPSSHWCSAKIEQSRQAVRLSHLGGTLVPPEMEIGDN